MSPGTPGRVFWGGGTLAPEPGLSHWLSRPPSWAEPRALRRAGTKSSESCLPVSLEGVPEAPARTPAPAPAPGDPGGKRQRAPSGLRGGRLTALSPPWRGRVGRARGRDPDTRRSSVGPRSAGEHCRHRASGSVGRLPLVPICRAERLGRAVRALCPRKGSLTPFSRRVRGSLLPPSPLSARGPSGSAARVCPPPSPGLYPLR